MEKTYQFNEEKDTTTCGTKRKLKKHYTQCPAFKRSKTSDGAKTTKAGAKRDKRIQNKSPFNLGYDRKASKSAVAGIKLKRKSSTILSILGPRKKMHTPISLGVKAMSPLIRYRGDDNVRISVLFHDGSCFR
ncbi:uncharacterized protein LOC143076885 [Mytilus galloprovincialis]|uniref:uncharacterized protein LOC143076885 n=1 Tax=Mytilus galloprovincialis TaxID=29158 RepID=UPI003F7B79A4